MSCSPTNLTNQICLCCGASYQSGGCVLGPDCSCASSLADVDACPLCRKCYEHCECSEEDRHGAIVRKAWVDFVIAIKGATAKPDHLLPYQFLGYWDKKVDQIIYEAVAKDVQQRQAATARLEKLNKGN